MTTMLTFFPPTGNRGDAIATGFRFHRLQSNFELELGCKGPLSCRHRLGLRGRVNGTSHPPKGLVRKSGPIVFIPPPAGPMSSKRLCLSEGQDGMSPMAALSPSPFEFDAVRSLTETK